MVMTKGSCKEGREKSEGGTERRIVFGCCDFTSVCAVQCLSDDNITVHFNSDIMTPMGTAKLLC